MDRGDTMLNNILQAKERMEVAEIMFNNAETDKEIDAAIAETENARLMRQELILRKKGERK